MDYGCIGRKLGHSFSKTIHSKLCDYSYELYELEPHELPKFMRDKCFKAINVTIPYKQDVIPYLDTVSERAKEIGAVNTIVNKNGQLHGYNTDFSGLSALACKTGIDFNGKKTVILGSGGTSKTAAAVAKAGGAREIYRVSRTARDGCIDYGTLYSQHRDTQIIINTTPCGMYPQLDGAAADLTRFSDLCGVLDAVYNPLRSKLITEALGLGVPAAGGLYMLVAQAVYAAEKFTGTAFSEADIENVYTQLLREKENIVLIGMPACGKTTLGSEIARRLNRPFIDTDIELEKEHGMKIPDIFKKGGEQLFRTLEAETVRRISAESGAVIATGGGAILKTENVSALKQNGRLCFINRPIDSIPATDSRPLSSDREKLMQLFKLRLPIYRSVCDIEIDGSGTPSTNTELILKEYGFES